MDIGWRLPTFEELRSLLWSEKLVEGMSESSLLKRVDENVAVELAFRKVFNGAGWWLWSSCNADEPSLSWCVGFDLGHFSKSSRRNAEGVRLVRNAHASPPWQEGDDALSRYLLSDCQQVVRDNKTGLDWKRDVEPGSYTWHDAMSTFHA